MVDNTQIEQGFKYLSAILMIVMGSIGIYFSILEEITLSTYFINGVILALLLYVAYSNAAQQREIHSKVNYIGKKLQNEEIIEQAEKTAEHPEQKQEEEEE